MLSFLIDIALLAAASTAGQRQLRLEFTRRNPYADIAIGIRWF
jgi:hypothetical protein